jgi:hypothetical protein
LENSASWIVSIAVILISRPRFGRRQRRSDKVV